MLPPSRTSKTGLPNEFEWRKKRRFKQACQPSLFGLCHYFGPSCFWSCLNAGFDCRKVQLVINVVVLEAGKMRRRHALPALVAFVLVHPMKEQGVLKERGQSGDRMRGQSSPSFPSAQPNTDHTTEPKPTAAVKTISPRTLETSCSIKTTAATLAAVLKPGTPSFSSLPCERRIAAAAAARPRLRCTRCRSPFRSDPKRAPRCIPRTCCSRSPSGWPPSWSRPRP
jgi:hypothetical protein